MLHGSAISTATDYLTRIWYAAPTVFDRQVHGLLKLGRTISIRETCRPDLKSYC
jgi:hypothetical protein